MQSKATTVEQYLAELSAERRVEMEAVRQVIRANLDSEYREGMQYGMIGYFVPHERYPAGYHCDPRQPLGFVGLASQKNYLSLYLMCLYSGADEERRFRAAWARTGKKLDMGKSCIRFKRADDLALDLIGAAISRMPVDKYIAFYEAAIKKNVSRKKGSGVRGKKAAGGKSKVAKRPAKKKAVRSKRAAR